MLNIEITPELPKGLWAYMCKRYGIRVVKKSDSCLMKMARPFTGIDKETWSRFSTLIGHTLYTDIKPGIATESLSLLGQIVMIPHECEHRLQDDNESFYGLRYLCSKNFRREMEVQAYTCSQEMCYFMTGQTIPVGMFIEKLKNYKLDDAQLEKAKNKLSYNTHLIADGEALMEPVKVAKAWLYNYSAGQKRSPARRVDLDRILD